LRGGGHDQGGVEVGFEAELDEDDGREGGREGRRGERVIFFVSEHLGCCEGEDMTRVVSRLVSRQNWTRTTSCCCSELRTREGGREGGRAFRYAI